MAPNSWKKALITVNYKKGYVTNPENFRPICGLPELYKLFSMMLYNWHYVVLDRYPSVPTRQNSERHSKHGTSL